MVWLVFPQTREVVVLTQEGEAQVGQNDPLPEHDALPGLSPTVAELFVQVP